MASPKVLAMREADAERRAQQPAPERRVCARADCELPGGVVYFDGRTKRMFKVKNSNLVKMGESYVHADPKICEERQRQVSEVRDRQAKLASRPQGAPESGRYGQPGEHPAVVRELPRGQDTGGLSELRPTKDGPSLSSIEAQDE